MRRRQVLAAAAAGATAALWPTGAQARRKPRLHARTINDEVGLLGRAYVVTVGSVAGGAITHGSQVNASNTGIAALGLTDGDLASTAGTTYSTNGQTVTNKLFTDTITVSGSNIILQGCKFTFGGGANTKCLVVTGTNVTVRNCTILPSSGSWYMGIHATGGTGLTVDACDISGCENNMSVDAGVDSVTVQYSYLHAASNASNPSGHRDALELYGGSGHVVKLSRLTHPAGETAVINIAPWFGSASVANASIDDCFIDGGNMHFVVDLQSTGSITNTRVRRNKMGGHTDPAVIGRYAALNDVDGRGIVNTEAALAANPNAILWPTTGPDVNRWDECSDLVPDLTGQIIA